MKQLKSILWGIGITFSLGFYTVGAMLAAPLEDLLCHDRDTHWWHSVRVDRLLNPMERRCRLCKRHQWWTGQNWSSSRVPWNRGHEAG